MKVIIAGSRTFSDYSLLKEKCDFFLQNYTDIEIVSGGALGADFLGETYANTKSYKLTIIPADWRIGKRAGPIRNKKLANYADALICFWDGKSKGSENMIKVAKENNLKIRIINY